MARSISSSANANAGPRDRTRRSGWNGCHQTEIDVMRKEGARDALKKRVASMTEERVAQLVAWMRSKRTGRFRRKQTPLQEFKGNLESMTNREVEEMLEGTRQRHSGYLASLIHLPTLALRTIVKMIRE
ncbi:MAG: hypothetical protein GX625_18265 [Clostridiaceae bacterium]|nr:hypothetical protein [Clostridiaceae bacterium]